MSVGKFSSFFKQLQPYLLVSLIILFIIHSSILVSSWEVGNRCHLFHGLAVLRIPNLDLEQDALLALDGIGEANLLGHCPIGVGGNGGTGRRKDFQFEVLGDCYLENQVVHVERSRV